MEDITVKDLAARMKNRDAPIIIDVREPEEYAIARIEGAILKPLGGLTAWARDLDHKHEYVMLCHTGMRSAYAAQVLQHMGFKKVRNLIGGIDAWSVYVDRSVPRY